MFAINKCFSARANNGQYKGAGPCGSSQQITEAVKSNEEMFTVRQRIRYYNISTGTA